MSFYSKWQCTGLHETQGANLCTVSFLPSFSNQKVVLSVRLQSSVQSSPSKQKLCLIVLILQSVFHKAQLLFRSRMVSISTLNCTTHSFTTSQRVIGCVFKQVCVYYTMADHGNLLPTNVIAHSLQPQLVTGCSFQ